MIHTKFLPGQDHRELMDYTLYLQRCGYGKIQFKRDDSAGFGSGFLVRFDDGTGDDAKGTASMTKDRTNRLAGARTGE